MICEGYVGIREGSTDLEPTDGLLLPPIDDTGPFAAILPPDAVPAARW